MIYSVIIPTFNRAEQLLLTLGSFQLQAFPKEQFEVIVIDDGSSDNTKEVVETFQASYSLVYLANSKNRGRSYARNKGIKNAKGTYLVFCDTDFIVTPEFLKLVFNYQKKIPNTIISATPRSLGVVYTHYYPEFNDKQKQDMFITLNNHSLWKNEFPNNNAGIINILKLEDLYQSFNNIEHFISPAVIDPFKKLQFQQTDVAPWLLFVTRCVTVKKGDVEKAGYFDEKITKYGLEDWELGFRLYNMGLSFISMEETVGFHQEHPREKTNRQNILSNLQIIYEKYGFSHPELNLLAVEPPWLNLGKYKNRLRTLERYKKTGRKPELKKLLKKWENKAKMFYNNKK
ncbi:glycosyltransferase family 2 protein [Anaerobacillus sp. CMMVII]|uniref:glycosyltransferase family 2 protein n=1 Tax=Anaerobacillus sp. CMMVII TaxID=2755588 RepID=UPI0021B81A73|nr:glycosyltransferase [Anaerobacillus sp. CMMVII]